MVADLFLPVIFIVIMYVIIGCVEDALTLLAIGSLFLPITFMFAQIVNSNGYTHLFGATLINNTVAPAFLTFGMLMISLFAFGKIFYMRRLSTRDDMND